MGQNCKNSELEGAGATSSSEMEVVENTPISLDLELSDIRGFEVEEVVAVAQGGTWDIGTISVQDREKEDGQSEEGSLSAPKPQSNGTNNAEGVNPLLNLMPPFPTTYEEAVRYLAIPAEETPHPDERVEEFPRLQRDLRIMTENLSVPELIQYFQIFMSLTRSYT